MTVSCVHVTQSRRLTLSRRTTWCGPHRHFSTIPSGYSGVIQVTACSPLLPLQYVKHGRIFHSHQPQTRHRCAGAFRRVPAGCAAADGCGQSRRWHLGTVHGVARHLDSLRDLRYRLYHSFVAPRPFPGMDGKILFRILHYQRQPRACSEPLLATRRFTPGCIYGWSCWPAQFWWDC